MTSRLRETAAHVKSSPRDCGARLARALSRPATLIRRLAGSRPLLAQHDALQFARRRFRQDVDELDAARIFVRGDVRLDVILQGANECGAFVRARTQHHECRDHGAAIGIRRSDDGALRDSPVAGEGHVHFFVDTPASTVPVGKVVPLDQANVYVHAGKEPFTSRELELCPGRHTITVVMADAAHIVVGQPQPASVTIDVE